MTERPRYVSEDDLEDVLRELTEYANGGRSASRSAVGRAVVEIRKRGIGIFRRAT